MPKKEKKPPKNRTVRKLRTLRKLRKRGGEIFDKVYKMEGFDGGLTINFWLFNHGYGDSEPNVQVQVDCTTEAEILKVARLLGAEFKSKADVVGNIVFVAEIDGVEVQLTGLKKVCGRDCEIKRKQILVCGDKEIDPATLLDSDGKPLMPATIGPKSLSKDGKA